MRPDPSDLAALRATSGRRHTAAERLWRRRHRYDVVPLVAISAVVLVCAALWAGLAWVLIQVL